MATDKEEKKYTVSVYLNNGRKIKFVTSSDDKDRLLSRWRIVNNNSYYDSVILVKTFYFSEYYDGELSIDVKYITDVFVSPFIQ